MSDTDLYFKKEAFARYFTEKLVPIAENHGKIYVFVHEHVDGDCIGSSCALCTALRILGADCEVLVAEELPFMMKHLNLEDIVTDITGKAPSEFEAAIAVDCADFSRMGGAGEIYKKCLKPFIVDHHASVKNDGDNMWVVPEASSASELVYYLICEVAKLTGKRTDELITARSAHLLLAGIITDTGRFAYTNTNPETLTAASELVKLGGNISSVMYWFFDCKQKEELLICSFLESQTHFDCGGKVASTVAKKELFEKFDAGNDSIGSVVSHLRDVDGVKVAFVLRETNDGKIRVNIRSEEPFNSSEFAEGYGGGGHLRAAGFTIEGRDIDELRDEIVSKASKLI